MKTGSTRNPVKRRLGVPEADRSSVSEPLRIFVRKRPKRRIVRTNAPDDDRDLRPFVQERESVLRELAALRSAYPKLFLPDSVIKGYLKPPATPAECIFSRTTLNLTADLKGKITPCQFGGTPDCTQCGCMASAGLQAIGDYRLFGFVPLRAIFTMSSRIGEVNAAVFNRAEQ